ncbi:PAS domain S-box-containing protein [Arcicella aurantiaca]|uniref:histidine kinase n=1 Tax=Arcicella aurantiaca TaxID=591202 RepID=A0A316EDL1_9BACT|nr:PAS domain-containing sensor histidine kinase [Arcicella aurantiaca]PWK28689.1 PAS domain S-box-containing protein [Arcicella aurantiaca]
MNLPISQALLETVFENTPSFMGVYNVNTHEFEFINQTGLNMLCVTDLEDFKKVFPHGFRKDKLSIKEHHEIAEHLQDNKVWSEEIIFENRVKDEFWGNLQISLFYDSDTPHYFIRITDISSRKKTEQQVKDEENRFEALFMHAAIGIIMVNREGKIVLSNHFADVLFGFQRGELMGNQLDILIPQNIKEQHQKTYQSYTHKPQDRAMGVGLDLHGRRKDGSLFPVEISLSHFKSGDTPYYISFINDTTFKKKAETDLLNKNHEIKKLNDSLEKEVINRTNALVETLKSLEHSKLELEIALNKEKELGELKSRFVSMASHEFRTPLTAIQSAASLIEKYQKTEEQDKRERHTQRIKAAVGNLTDILEEFLSVGKLEEGKVETKISTFDLPELMQECIVDLTSITRKGQKINYQHSGDLIVKLDKSLLRKIIINLCSNALKFSPENSTIDVLTECKVDQLILKIADKGIGISAEDQKHLFDRFFRGANVTNIQGTGLGLHIVARYAELLNGKVTVESELNVGTTFIVVLNF